MERMILIEVVDQDGRMVERFKTTRFPVRIGRAYDNDLIIDDPYVCPHHCEMVFDETGSLVIHDLASVNGIHAPGKKGRSTNIKVESNQQLRIGRTLLRFRHPSQSVDATLEDKSPIERGNQWPPQSSLISVAIFLGAVAVMTLANYLESFKEFEYSRYVFKEQIPILMIIIGWTAIWSIISRITVHKFAFIQHATIFVTISLVVFFGEYLLDFMAFGFATQRPFEYLDTVFSVIAFAWLLFLHLRLCSEQKRSRLMAASALIATVFVATVELGAHLEEERFSSNPGFSTTLKPPSFQLVESQPVDEFLDTADLLKTKVDEEIAEDRESNPVEPDMIHPVSDSRPE